MDQSTHHCTRCDATKSVSEFGKNSRSPSGLKSWCRPCSNTYAREWLSNNPESLRRQRAATAKWREANPEQMLEHARTYKKRHGVVIATRKRSQEYREQARAWRREYIKDPANRERIAQVHKAWRDANPEVYRSSARLSDAKRRARKKDVQTVHFTHAQLDARLQVFGYKCWMCGGPFEHIDHVKPLRLNGPHILANLRPACSSCNMAKSGRWYGVAGLHKFLN